MLREKYIARAAPLVFSPGGGDKYGVNLCTPLCGPPSLEEKALRLMMAEDTIAENPLPLEGGQGG